MVRIFALVLSVVFVASAGAQTQQNMILAERQKSVSVVLAKIAAEFSSKLKGMSLENQDRFWQEVLPGRSMTKAESLLRESKQLAALAKLGLGGSRISCEPVLELPKGIGDCTLVGTYIGAGLPSSLKMAHQHGGVLLRLFDKEGGIFFYGARWDSGKKLSLYVPDGRSSAARVLTEDHELQKKCRDFFGDKAVSVSPY